MNGTKGTKNNNLIKELNMTKSEFDNLLKSKDYEDFKKNVESILDNKASQFFKDIETTKKENKVELTYGQRLKYVDDLIGRYLSANYETVFNDTEQGFLNYILKNHPSNLNAVRNSNISDGSQASELKRFTQKIVDATINEDIKFSVKTSQE